MMPSWVSAGTGHRRRLRHSSALRLVGQCFGQPEIQHLDGAVRPDLDVGGFRSRWTIPCAWAASSASAICRAMGSASSSATGPCAIRSASVGPSTNSRTSAWTPSRLLEAEDRADVGMVERCEHLGFALESGKAIWIEREAVRENLERDVAIQPGVVGLIHLAHSARANRRETS